MACLIYPYFPIEVPTKLREILRGLDDKRIFQKAVLDFQNKNILGGREYFLKHDRSIMFWVRKILFNEDDAYEPIAEISCQKELSETIEDLYISKDLKFVLRGKLLMYKSSGKVYDVECSDIEPIFKGNSLSKRELAKELSEKLVDTVLPKSASYAMPNGLEAKTAESASYANIISVSPKKFDRNSIDFDEVNKIFEELIKDNPGAKNPMVDYIKNMYP